MVGRPLSEHTVDRHGLVLLAGFVTDGNNGAPRIDLILPMPLASAPQFRVGLSAQYDHASAEIPDLAISAYAVAVGAKALYDWRLPIATYAGDFVVSVEGGPFLARVWLKIDEPYMPGDYEGMTGLGLNLAASVQYRAHSGLIVSVQPLGLNVPIANTEPSNTGDVTFTADTEWEGALLCGYQFR